MYLDLDNRILLHLLIGELKTSSRLTSSWVESACSTRCDADWQVSVTDAKPIRPRSWSMESSSRKFGCGGERVRPRLKAFSNVRLRLLTILCVLPRHPYWWSFSVFSRKRLENAFPILRL